MGADRSRDARALREDSYADSSRLRQRYDVYQYRERDFDMHAAVLAHVPVGTARLLDAGCGPAPYLRRLRTDGELPAATVALDLSPGMLAEVDLPVARVAGDHGRLPFVAGGFDCILATHTLYHAADLAGAVAELARVLRPGGVLLATTNGDAHWRQLRSIAPPLDRAMAAFQESFSLENGARFLAPHFDVEGPIRWGNRLRFTAAEPVSRYVQSLAGMSGSSGSGAAWSGVIAATAAAVGAAIESDGHWTVDVEPGLFVARRR